MITSPAAHPHAAHSTAGPTFNGSTLPPSPHEDAKAAAKTDLVGGKQGSVTTETLDNGVRIIVAERPGAASTKIQFGIGAGSMQDPAGKLGAAHLLEHLAFEGSPTMSGAKQEALRTKLGGRWNAYTNQEQVVYYGIVPNKDAATGAKLLADMFQNPNVKSAALEQERAAVKNEILYRRPLGVDQWEGFNKLVYGNSARANNIIGTNASIDAIKPADLKGFHDNYFSGRNTVVLVEGDKRHLPLDEIRAELSKLPAGARVDHAGEALKIREGKAIQQLQGDDTDAVELVVALPFDKEAFEKIDPLQRKLVQTSLNEKLHETLRRNHDLTYGASAQFMLDDAADGALLVIETTVAPDAVRAATRDILSVADDARDGFGAQTLKAHKQSVVARMKQQEPTLEAPPTSVTAVAEKAFQDALKSPGVTIGTLDPEAVKSPRAQKAAFAKDMRRVQAITQQQFAKAASKLIDLDDVKVMVVGDADVADVRAGMRDAGLKTTDVKTLDPIVRRGDS